MGAPNPYLVVSELIANAIDTARVCGENRRISTLVAGSVGRFMAEKDDDGALLDHAMSCIADDDTAYVPILLALLQALTEKVA